MIKQTKKSDKQISINLVSGIVGPLYISKYEYKKKVGYDSKGKHKQ